MKRFLALCFLSLMIFNVQAQGADITQYDVGVRMQGPNPEPTPLGELTGSGTAPDQYNIIRQDVRDVLKSSSDQMRSDVKADRPARDAISVGSSGSTLGNKSSTMSNAYNMFVTSGPCNGIFVMENYFTGGGTGACVIPMPGDANYCTFCSSRCPFDGSTPTAECTSCAVYCPPATGSYFGVYGGS